jgi:hypothetical protein
MSVVLALVAAVTFAFAAALQQKGALETSVRASDPRFYMQLFAKRIWLVGCGLQITGGLLQLAALRGGALVVVQPILMLSLVFALPAGHWITGQAIGRRQIVGAITVVVGLIVFLSLAHPEGGVGTPAASRWWIALGVVMVLVVTVLVLSRGRPPAMVAGLLGTAAGLVFGFEAAILKLFTTQLGQGIAHLLAQWSTYALIVFALAGAALQQASLKPGVLPAAMATVNVANLVTSVAVGLYVFQETLSSNGLERSAAVGGLAVTIAGVVVLSRAPSAHPVPETQVANG